MTEKKTLKEKTRCQELKADSVKHYKSGCRGYNGHYIFNIHPRKEEKGKPIEYYEECQTCGWERKKDNSLKETENRK